MQVEKSKFSDEEILELAISAGAKDCISNAEYHEIVTEKEDFYKVKSEIEKKVVNFSYSAIEWRPHSYLNLSKEQSNAVIQMLETLEDDDDVQNTFINCKINI